MERQGLSWQQNNPRQREDGQTDVGVVLVYRPTSELLQVITQILQDKLIAYIILLNNVLSV